MKRGNDEKVNRFSRKKNTLTKVPLTTEKHECDVFSNCQTCQVATEDMEMVLDQNHLKQVTFAICIFSWA